MVAQILAIFVTVFLAELGDKTQLATLLFAAEGRLSPWLVFGAAAAALVAATAAAVLAGALMADHAARLPLKLIAGLGFVAIGVWTIIDHFRAAG